MTTALTNADRIFRVLADPVRLAMIERLAAGPATIGELGATHAISKPAISKHVAVLHDTGLLERRRRGQQVVCTLRPEPLAVAETWLRDRRTYWAATLDRLAAHLDTEPATETARSSDDC